MKLFLGNSLFLHNRFDVEDRNKWGGERDSVPMQKPNKL